MQDNELSSTSRSSSPETPPDESINVDSSFSMASDSNFWSLSPLSRVKPQPPLFNWTVVNDSVKQEPNFDLLFSEMIRDDALQETQPSTDTVSETQISSPIRASEGHESNKKSLDSDNVTQNRVLDDQESIAESSNSHPVPLQSRVVYPSKDSYRNLSINFPNLPESGTKSRVETQIKLILDLVQLEQGAVDALAHRVGSWSCLRLPSGSSTRRRSRKDPKIEAKPEETLYLETVITCASSPHLKVSACASCQNREAKRVARKIAARVRPSKSDEEENHQSFPPALEGQTERHNDGNGIVQYNCAETMDFSEGTVSLPIRITCYCRHHKEKLGFRVTFFMRNHLGDVVGQGTTPPIMITDDHKTSNKLISATEAEYDLTGSRQIANRGLTSNVHPRRRKTKPYDGVRPAIIRNSPPFSTKESTPVSPSHSFTPELEGCRSIETLMSSSIQESHEPVATIPPNMASSSSNIELFRPETAPPTPFNFFSVTPGGMDPTIPHIQRLIPQSGPIHGGVEITILGSGFSVSGNYNVLFGGHPATFSQRWSDNAIVCLLPPAASAGMVKVQIEGFENDAQENSLFTYVDENERALMELALQVVGMKMTGKIENAKDVAMRIVGSGQETAFSSTPIDSSGMMQMSSGLGTAHGLESMLLKLISLLDLPDQSRVSTKVALALSSVSRQNLLHLAIQNRLPRLARALLMRNIDVDARDGSGFTSMHFAVLVGWQEGVDLLQEFGADMEIVDAVGRAPADIERALSSSTSRQHGIRLALSDAGEDADVEDEVFDSNNGSLNGRTADESKIRRKAIKMDNSRKSEEEQGGHKSPTSKLKLESVYDSSYAIYDWLRQNLTNIQAGSHYLRMNMIYPGNLPKQLPTLLELPPLPQIANVFPVYVPIPWPVLNRSDNSVDRRTDKSNINGEDTKTEKDITTWRATWERCLAQISQNPPPPDQFDPPPQYTESQAQQKGGQSIISTQPTNITLRKRKNTTLNTPSHEMPENVQEVPLFKYRSSRVDGREGGDDRMLIWFWLPALLLGLVWAAYLSSGPLYKFWLGAN